MLVELGHEVREEVRTDEGYSLDVVVQVADCEVAIEVDGPSHFVGRSHTPTGATMLKRRQLRAAGWRLLPVPYFEWDRLNASSRREYLSHALQRFNG